MPETQAPPASSHPLDTLFCPGSIAVIGASADPRKIGGRPIAYMLRSGFAGKLYPVNPKQDEVQGLRAYPSLAAIGHPVDQVIVAVAGAHVEAAVEDAIAQHARSIVIFSSGFGELDETGRQAQERLARRCAEAGVQLVGPNCIGIFSSARSMYSTFMSAIEHDQFPAGTVGIVSQSGAIGSYLYGLAGERGVRFSHFVATGNEAGIDVADCIDWMAQDPATSVILVYLEGCRDGQRLRRALNTAREHRKPVIVMKVGSSEQGAAAAASHTGSLAGADSVFDAIFRETNAWRAHSLVEMADLGYACSIAPMPRGNRLGVITPSGGVGVIAADEAARCGLVLPALPEAVQAEVRRIVPFASGVNPVDTTGQVVSDRSLFTQIMQLVFSYDGFDSILSFNANIGKNAAEYAKVSGALYALRERHPERTIALSMGARAEIVQELEDHGILYFADPAVATRTLGAMAAIAAGFDEKPADAAAQLRRVALPAGAIDEMTARNVLEQYGIPFAPQRMARSADEAVAMAGQLGYPLVMKVLSADIAHKSDVGGVLLNLRDADSVRTGWNSMMATVSARCPDAVIDGAILSPMITGGVETVLGVNNDPVFGPVMMFGLGGVFVEIFKDVTFRSAPVEREAALRMIGNIRGRPLLQGARGRPPVDLDCLADAIVALSGFAAAHRDELASVEINPFIVRETGGYAVDALIVRK